MKYQPGSHATGLLTSIEPSCDAKGTNGSISKKAVNPYRLPGDTVDAAASQLQPNGATVTDASSNPGQTEERRTQRRITVQQALDRISVLAKENPKLRFNNLLWLIADVEQLRAAYKLLKRRAAPGIDGVRWKEYGDENLDDKLKALSLKILSGRYRPLPSIRKMIPKSGGGERPLSIPSIEDKLVQRSTVMALGRIYEMDFKNSSYGFRPKRGCKQALKSLKIACEQKRSYWVLDVDLKAFFDSIDHSMLLKLLRIRIADPRVLKLIERWLKVGFYEKGSVKPSAVGTPQGGIISPLLANVFLHQVLDGWFVEEMMVRSHGYLQIFRYADDFVILAEYNEDATWLRKVLRTRMEAFHLKLHDDNTAKNRLISLNNESSGDRSSFKFLGMNHTDSWTRNGIFRLSRRPAKFRKKINEITTAIWKADMDEERIQEILKFKASGYIRYFDQPDCYRQIKMIRREIALTLQAVHHGHRIYRSLAYWVTYVTEMTSSKGHMEALELPPS